MGAGQSNNYQSKEAKIFGNLDSPALLSQSQRRTKRDGTILRGKQEIVEEYDKSTLPTPIKSILKLDYCWRLTYTMFKHSFVLAAPLTFIHFIWTQSPKCWEYRFKTFPYKHALKNYAMCILIINAVNTFWSVVGEEYW